MSRRAIFTIVQNETYFLEIWLRYYKKYYKNDEIYILNHNTQDKEAKELLEDAKDTGINVININNIESYNHIWLRDTVQIFQSFLLNSHRCVTFAEVDEILVLDKEIIGHADLAKYSDETVGRRRAIGYNIIQRQDDLHDVTFECDPFMYQFKYWTKETSYDKTLIATEPISWDLGFHQTTYNVQPPHSSGLFLIHLHKMSYNLCRARHERQSLRNWSKSDMIAKRGYQNRIFKEPEFFNWYYKISSLIEQMPKHIRSSF